MSDPSSLILHLRGNHGAIRIPPKDNDSVARALRILDRVSPEEFHAVGVLYIGEEQSTEQQILSNQYGSERYAKFLRYVKMPTLVETLTITIFLGSWAA